MTMPTPDYTILGLLASKSQHGYQILETFNDPQQLGSVWRMSNSQIYAVLKRLESQGWVKGHEQSSQNAPSRFEYEITNAGRAQLINWLNEPYPSPSIRRVRVEFMSRLYIAHLLELPTQPVIQCQQIACQEERARLLQTQAEPLQDEHVISVGWLTSELIIAQLDAVLQWIDRCALLVSPVPS